MSSVLESLESRIDAEDERVIEFAAAVEMRAQMMNKDALDALEAHIKESDEIRARIASLESLVAAVSRSSEIALDAKISADQRALQAETQLATMQSRIDAAEKRADEAEQLAKKAEADGVEAAQR